MTSKTDQSQILSLIETATRALHDKDAAALVAQYTDDAVIFDLAPPLAHPIDRQGLAGWLAGWDGPVDREFRDFNVTVSGDLAFCHGLVRMIAKTGDGEDATWWMRTTICLRRDSNGWRIVHKHESVPFYMDGSYRAAVDLAP